MEQVPLPSRSVRFGTFEIDFRAGELRKDGVKLKLTGQPFQVLTILLERPGEVVTRDELQKILWPDTFVDVDHNLNTAINKIREALGDSAESPRFVETLPKRGYRFIATINGVAVSDVNTTVDRHSSRNIPWRHVAYTAGAVAAVSLVLALVFHTRSGSSAPRHQRSLTRITFDSGQQIGASWSPDGRLIAYGSDRGGKFDVWVQQASGGDPVQVTYGLGQNWQPDWSPDGKYIAYRSEAGRGGIYVTPALGGAGLERQISSYGYKPRWSPDGSQILFQRDFVQGLSRNKLYVVSLDGAPPREILTDFIEKNDLWPASAVWWRRSDEVSFWSNSDKPSPDFWTVQISGHSGKKLTITPDVERQLREAAGGSEFAGEFSFAWSASGTVVYFERNYRGARNIWKMTIDPEAFRATAVERLTTGPGPDNGIAVSADGQKLAFTANSEQVRSWLFPFDATTGRVLGEGHAVSPSSLMAWEQDLSRDGKKIVFWGGKYGVNKSFVYQGTLEDARVSPVIADDRTRGNAHWSPDGTQLVYAKNCSDGAAQLMLWSAQTHTEEPLTGTCSDIISDGDWSPDGRNILAMRLDTKTQHWDVWLFPVSARPSAETAARKLITCSGCDLWQPHFSPDGRWIVFEAAAELPTTIEDKIYVAPAGGGPWTAITDGQQFAGKPRWAPDGKTIYFLSQEDGYFNVWARRFEPTTGTPIGAPRRVTSFARPKFMIPSFISPVGFSLTQDRLLLSIVEVSGSIWMLDNVDE